jgi:ElaB/YqjD/DUF883 family membrane-anchored ribosome-binding protein
MTQEVEHLPSKCKALNSNAKKENPHKNQNEFKEDINKQLNEAKKTMQDTKENSIKRQILKAK